MSAIVFLSKAALGSRAWRPAAEARASGTSSFAARPSLVRLETRSAIRPCSFTNAAAPESRRFACREKGSASRLSGSGSLGFRVRGFARRHLLVCMPPAALAVHVLVAVMMIMIMAAAAVVMMMRVGVDEHGREPALD